MKYLINYPEHGGSGATQSDSYPSNSIALGAVADGNMEIFRFHEGVFQFLHVYANESLNGWESEWRDVRNSP